MILALIDEAVRSGARRGAACRLLGLSPRTVERWQHAPTDGRPDAVRSPSNRLSTAERQAVLAVANAPKYRDLTPHQIVPHLADAGQYLASESTMYRLLRAAQQLQHRGRTKVPVRRPPRAHVATGPNQVWSWDITYLRTPVRGSFAYLYLMLDIWSRKIMGWAIHETERADHAALLFRTTCRVHTLDPRGIVLHADNGGPMKGATMVATLERLGVLASFSRPGVSNDNAYSEALFRTLKYRPTYPRRPFADLTEARAWTSGFVRWYNADHLHSTIRFVTPNDRHAGREAAVLEQRRAVYEAARHRRPDRWRGPTRNWEPIQLVRLNPDRDEIPSVARAG